MRLASCLTFSWVVVLPWLVLAVSAVMSQMRSTSSRFAEVPRCPLDESFPE